MTYSRCGIVALTERKSRFLEIQTDRTSYLLGDVVLVTINAKMDHMPKYESVVLLVSCVGTISRTFTDAKMPPNPKVLSKTYFEMKNEFMNQNFPLSYSFSLPGTSPFTGEESSFVLTNPIISQIFKISAMHSYRIDLFVKQDGKIYLAEQKDIVVRRTFQQIQPSPSWNFEIDNFKIKIVLDKPSYYPQENGFLLFEVNSKVQRSTSIPKVSFNQTLIFNFDDQQIVVKKQIIPQMSLPAFQPYYYGKRPLLFKIPEGLPPSHSTPLFKVEYSFDISTDLFYEGGAQNQLKLVLKSTILAPPNLCGACVFMPLITNDFNPPSESILRPFWQEDKSTDTCGICGASFGLITRRHHCRRCGKVFCGSCCVDSVLMKDLGFDRPERVCKSCFKLIQSN
ncbi:A kinase anchor protein, putative [Entamoeba dispar SAW760]|uniref:A kinase anchor protein, putative n=1 Tax=Entamoeba dispar (strain ATCC PRA-260 / SAW760) TaxID=370354 RepID=B0EL62_ENTDS|nr:A kinase anchor protein, putative [Entamoeba dispar SAW760]EDR24750.1 A kinase anchor protein, putative [Entamoeba dispar SAW760]|eukprot:EDR24750.1 A kinase anchor protein, putative [Entamoeba dispar SAW760]